MPPCSVYLGWDPRETVPFTAAWFSLMRHLSESVYIRKVVLGELQQSGLYTRPTHRNDVGRLIDELSKREDYDGSMSTEHAIARFLVPHLAKTGWALFADCDVLFRRDVIPLFESLDPRFPLYCVKHQYQPTNATKMDGQIQTVYPRKNWSSVMAFNCDHPANKALTLEMVNTLPGRDLHNFPWLKDEEIGELAPEWNWLVGHSDVNIDPAIVHFTEGTPDMEGYERCAFADDWRREIKYK